MEKPIPEVIVIDCGPTQPFRNLNPGHKFFDHLGNLCIKVNELNGVNSVTVEPIDAKTPMSAWITDMAPVRPARFS